MGIDRRTQGGWRAVLAIAALLATVPTSSGAAGSFRLPGLRGGELTSREVAAGTTVVVVWASWSPRCRDIGEQANALLERWSGRAQVVTVNFQEDREVAQAFAGEQGLRAPVFLDQDGEFAKAFAVTNLPGLLILRDGQPVFSGRLTPDADQVIGEQVR